LIRPPPRRPLPGLEREPLERKYEAFDHELPLRLERLPRVARLALRGRLAPKEACRASFANPKPLCANAAETLDRLAGGRLEPNERLESKEAAARTEPEPADREELPRNDCAGELDPRNWLDDGRFEANDVTRRESFRVESFNRPVFQELAAGRFAPPAENDEKPRGADAPDPHEFRAEKELREPPLDGPQPFRERAVPENDRLPP
jgi:hypothetical protein